MSDRPRALKLNPLGLPEGHLEPAWQGRPRGLPGASQSTRSIGDLSDKLKPFRRGGLSLNAERELGMDSSSVGYLISVFASFQGGFTTLFCS